MNKVLASLAGLLFLAPGNVISCGPEFPESLLVARQQALLSAPPVLFSKEIKKLLPPVTEKLPLAESTLMSNSTRWDSTDTVSANFIHERQEEEKRLFPTAQLAAVANMRQQADGDAAYQVGANVDEALRLYTAASVDFVHGAPVSRIESNDEESDNFTATLPVVVTLSEQQQQSLSKATQHFGAILDLADTGQSAIAVWANYMLGRIAALQNEPGKAEQFFQQTRQRVLAGAPDNLGLAVASLGEQARLHLKPGEISLAVQLYLQQLAYGSKNALNSLKYTAQIILNNQDLLDEAISDKHAQGLIFAYIYSTHAAAPFYGLNGYFNQQFLLQYVMQQPGSDANAYLEQRLLNRISQQKSASKPWLQILASLKKMQIKELQGADWLAAEAYWQGDYPAAEKFLQYTQSALAFWLKAKLALRDGDQTAALAALDASIKAFLQTEPVSSPALVTDLYEVPMSGDQGDWLEQYSGISGAYQVSAEQGVLRLARGEFLQAMTLFYQAANRFWEDTAYIAEKVLTVDELKQFVDEHTRPATNEEKQAAVGEQQKFTVDIKLRQLLARRLLREGRYDQAISYFELPELVAYATAYRDNLQQTKLWWHSDTYKAKALYETAHLARAHGLELLGYELAPDFAIWNGNWTGCMGTLPEGCPWLPTSWTSKPELKRLIAHTEDRYDRRFHYRLLASDYAQQAADLLPPRSQAFAALLCKATGWLLVREPDLAKPIYQRYLREGAYVSWGKQFGQTCPEPDFEHVYSRVAGVRWRRWLW